MSDEIKLIPGEFGPEDVEEEARVVIEEKPPEEIIIEEQTIEETPTVTPKSDNKVSVKFFEKLPKGWDFEADTKAKKKLKRLHPKKFGKPLKKLRRGTRGGKLAKWLYNWPIIGKRLVLRATDSGCIVANVVFPNMRALSYLIPMNKDFIEIEINDSTRFFDVKKLQDEPEKYIRVEEGIPKVLFYWDFPEPIPIRPTTTQILDLNTYGVLILRQRAKAAAQPIKEFLDNVGKNVKLTMVLSIINLLGTIATIGRVLGYI